MRMYKLIPLFSIIFISLFLTSCGSSANKNNIATSKGEMIKMSLEEIQEKDSSLSGFYIMNKDETFTPVMAGSQGYAGSTTENDSTRFLWYSISQLDLSKLIPTVTNDTPLVAIFSDDDDMPSLYTIERYKFKGYTLGCKFLLGEDQNSLFINAEETCEESDIEAILSSNKLTEEYEISTFNKSEALPIANLDLDIGVLLGLEKNKYYEIGFYKGTSTKILTAEADTVVFKSDSITTLKKPVQKTNKGYFIINLPDNLKEGYYYICDAGLFKYKN